MRKRHSKSQSGKEGELTLKISVGIKRFLVILIIIMMVISMMPALNRIGATVYAASHIDARGANIIKVTSADDFAAGSLEGLKADPDVSDALTLEDGAIEGTFISSEYNVDDFLNMVGSWNASIPQGSYIEVSARAYTDGKWSGWFSWGKYGMFIRRQNTDSNAIDTFSPGGTISMAQFKAVLHRDDASSKAPVLRQMTFSISGGDAVPKYAEEVPSSIPERAMTKAPAYSQLIRDPDIGSSICSPTTMTVLLNSRNPELDLIPEELALSIQDFNYHFGNWSYTASSAGLYGYESYVAYADKETLLYELASGRSVGLSVKYSNEPGGKYPYLEGAYNETGGHLIAIVGYEYEGGIRDDDHLYFISADSYSAGDSTAYHRYKWTQLDEAWKGRAAYLVSSEPEKNAEVTGVIRHEAELVNAGRKGTYEVRSGGRKLDLRNFRSGKQAIMGRGVIAYTVEGFSTDHSEKSTTSIVYSDRLQVTANNTFYYSDIETDDSGMLVFNSEEALYRLGVPEGEKREVKFYIFTNDGHSYRASLDAVSKKDDEDFSQYEEIDMGDNLHFIDLSKGVLKGDARRNSGGYISLASDDKSGIAQRGEYYSPIYNHTRNAEYLMATLNAYTPGASSAELQIRTITQKSAGAWSNWMSWGKFGSGIESASAGGGDENVKLNTDVLFAKGSSAEANIRKVQFRVILRGDGNGEVPTVFGINYTIKTEVYSDTEGRYMGGLKAEDLPESASLSADPMTSYVHAEGLAGWRFENLMTMMLNAVGTDALYEEVALNGYDFNGGWGNWAFTPFKAGLFGNTSYTQYGATPTMVKQAIAEGNAVGLFVNTHDIKSTNTSGNRQVFVYGYKTEKDGTVTFDYICPAGDDDELEAGDVLNSCSEAELKKAIEDNSSESVAGAMYVVGPKVYESSVRRIPVFAAYNGSGRVELSDKSGPVKVDMNFEEDKTSLSGCGSLMYIFGKDLKDGGKLATNLFSYDIAINEDGSLMLPDEAVNRIAAGEVMTLYMVINNGITYRGEVMNDELLNRLKKDAVEALKNEKAAMDPDAYAAETMEEADKLLFDYTRSINEARSAGEVEALLEEGKSRLQALSPITPLVRYEFIEGEGDGWIDGRTVMWKKGSKTGLDFRVNGDLDKFLYVKVDGEELEDKYCKVERGSTIIRLYPAYLETLSIGEHSLTAVYRDGEAETTFVVGKADTALGDKTPDGKNHDNKLHDDKLSSDSPNTGDHAPKAAFLYMGSLAAAALILRKLSKSRKIHKDL